MRKKIILACAVMSAFLASALPATTTASPRLCETESNHTNCNNLAVGKNISAHNVGHSLLLSSSGNELATCTTAYLTGILTSNSGTHMSGNVTNAYFGGSGSLKSGGTEPECTGSFGNISVDTTTGNGTPWCITAAGAAHTFTVRGNECSKEPRSITFVLTSTTIGACKYSRAAAMTSTYNTDFVGTKDAILTLIGSINTEFLREEGSIFCPAAVRLQMSFTLETDPETPLTHGTTNPITDPLYIK